MNATGTWNAPKETRTAIDALIALAKAEVAHEKKPTEKTAETLAAARAEYDRAQAERLSALAEGTE